MITNEGLADLKQIILVFDNAKYHTSDTSTNFISQTGITALSLPPYHPEFNPCELAINFIKRNLDKDRHCGK